MLRVMVAAVATLSLVATACGGDGITVSVGDQPGATDTATGVDPDLEAIIAETAELALALFGDDLPTTGVALLVAHDSGYSFEQIVAGVRSGALTAEGTIDGVEPELAYGSFAGPAAAAPRDWDVEEVSAALQHERDKNFTTRDLIEAISLGVPAARIAQAIVLGDLARMVERAGCGRESSSYQSDCLDDIERVFGPAIVEPFDRVSESGGDTGERVVFRGTGTLQDTAVLIQVEGSHTCERSGPMELVLLADGTGWFTYDAGIAVVITFGEDNEIIRNCVDGSGNSYQVEHDPVAGTFTVFPVFSEWSTPDFTPEQRSFGDRLDSWDVGGTWTVETASGGGTSQWTDSVARNTTTFTVTLCSDEAPPGTC